MGKSESPEVRKAPGGAASRSGSLGSRFFFVLVRWGNRLAMVSPNYSTSNVAGVFRIYPTVPA